MVTLDKKLQKAKNRVHRILNKYDNNRDFIQIKASDYRKFKDPKLKSIYNDYKTLMKNEKKVKNIQQIIGDDDSDDDDGTPARRQYARPRETTTASSQDSSPRETQSVVEHNPPPRIERRATVTSRRTRPLAPRDQDQPPREARRQTRTRSRNHPVPSQPIQFIEGQYCRETNDNNEVSYFCYYNKNMNVYIVEY